MTLGRELRDEEREEIGGERERVGEAFFGEAPLGDAEVLAEGAEAASTISEVSEVLDTVGSLAPGERHQVRGREIP